MSFNLTRRAALAQALALIGASGSLATLVSCEAALAEPVAIKSYFNAAEMAKLTIVADVMIPETDTPGALKAGIPGFVDAMMTSWAGPRAQSAMTRLLVRLDADAATMFGKNFLALANSQRVAVIDAIDRASFAPGSDVTGADYRLLKKLVFLGYTTSEAANPLYLANPGEYRGDLTRAEYDALVRAHV